MTEEIRIGLIGCGGIMNRHIRELEPLHEVHVTALADPDPTRRLTAKERWAHLRECAEYDDYAALLEAEDLTGIVIASPHTVHYEQIMAGLDRGVHVLVEKPMTCRIDRAIEVVRKVRETGLTLVIGYQRHYGGAYRYIRGAVADGRIGPVQTVHAYQGQGWKVATKGLWRQVPELSGGGQLNDSGSHLVDIMLWMTGLEAETVSARLDNRGTPVDINAALSVRFRGGALGTLNVVGDYPGADMYEDISIMGDAGGFHIRQGRPLMEITGRDGPVLTVDTAALDGGSIAQNFIRSIQGAEQPAAPAECGLRVIELTEAAWKSGAAGGKPVTVPRTEL